MLMRIHREESQPIRVAGHYLYVEQVPVEHDELTAEQAEQNELSVGHDEPAVIIGIHPPIASGRFAIVEEYLRTAGFTNQSHDLGGLLAQQRQQKSRLPRIPLLLPRGDPPTLIKAVPVFGEDAYTIAPSHLEHLSQEEVSAQEGPSTVLAHLARKAVTAALLERPRPETTVPDEVQPPSSSATISSVAAVRAAIARLRGHE